MNFVKNLKLLLAGLAMALVAACNGGSSTPTPPPPADIVGCMDAKASNYNPAATKAGKCTYAPAPVPIGNPVEAVFDRGIFASGGMGDLSKLPEPGLGIRPDGTAIRAPGVKLVDKFGEAVGTTFDANLLIREDSTKPGYYDSGARLSIESAHSARIQGSIDSDNACGILDQRDRKVKNCGNSRLQFDEHVGLHRHPTGDILGAGTLKNDTDGTFGIETAVEPK